MGLSEPNRVKHPPDLRDPSRANKALSLAGSVIPMPLRHHEIFSHFPRWAGTVWRGFDADFLGVQTRATFVAGSASAPADQQNFPPLPPFDEDYFEWVSLFEAIAHASALFTMIELGAGYGRWLVRGALAASKRGLQYRLIGVEAEPTHFLWMEQHTQDNHVSPSAVQLVWAAVTDHDGVTWFRTGDPSISYGQSLAPPHEIPSSKWVDIGSPVTLDTYTYLPVQVNAVSLSSLLRPLDCVDLIDLDIQGAELDVLAAAHGPLADKVRQVHIGTHSHEVEAGLRHLFGDNLGWTCRYDYPCLSASETPYGRIEFQDGVQVWWNPAVGLRATA